VGVDSSHPANFALHLTAVIPWVRKRETVAMRVSAPLEI
jgi:hypothetical protein